MSMILTATALMLQPTPAPELDWLAGYWLSCEGGREVSETWSDRRGTTMLAFSFTFARGRAAFEQMRIEFTPAAGGTAASVSFIAQQPGQAPVPFRLVRHSRREAVFENPAHDFPQRVIYRRTGNRLDARIEGAGGRSMDWHYRAARLNARCPGA
jgi:hypothetical protein